MSDDNDNNTYDTIVIGGGIAGLRAGYVLATKGNENVLVLEASERLGGRIRSQRLPVREYHDHPTVELGAELVHGSTGDAHELLVEIGDVEFEPVFTWAQGDGGPYPNKEVRGKCGYYWLDAEQRMLRFDTDDPDFHAMNAAIKNMYHVELRDPLSLRTYLDLYVPQRMHSLVVAGYANTMCGTLDMSVNSIIESEDDSLKPEGRGEFIVRQALTDTFIPYLCSPRNMHVHLNSAAQKVDWSTTDTNGSDTELIKVYTIDGAVHYARNVVVAVPVSMIQCDCVVFSPTLPPQQRKALDDIYMESAMKIVVELSKRFWPDDMAGLICADTIVPEWWVLQGTKRCILMGFVTSTHARRLACWSKSHQRVLIVRQLSKMFKVPIKEMESAVENFLVHNWNDEPYIRGGYTSPSDVNRVKATAPLGKHGRRVYFVGEYASPAHGTINAALLTGESAAMQIIEETQGGRRSAL